MKKAFACILGILLIEVTNMQAQHFVGFHLGYAQSITRLNKPDKIDSKTLHSTILNDLKLGLVYDATIIKGFGVSMALNYTFGANATDWTSKHNTSIYPKVRSKGQYHQLEIPVDWQYKFVIAKRTWLILYTGPTLQYGLSFKNNSYINDGKNETFDCTMDNYSMNETDGLALQQLNVTWGLGAGFQYERYFLRGGYDFGLINPYKAQSFTGKDIYTRGRFDQWQIKLGMYLWEK